MTTVGRVCLIAQLASELYALVVFVHPLVTCVTLQSAAIVMTRKVLMDWHTAMTVIKSYASAVGIKISKRMVLNALDATISSRRCLIKPRNLSISF